MAYRSVPRRLSSDNPPKVRRVFSARPVKAVEPEPVVTADANGSITDAPLDEEAPKRRRKSTVESDD